jgi:hypothetical protein
MSCVAQPEAGTGRREPFTFTSENFELVHALGDMMKEEGANSFKCGDVVIADAAS